MRRPKGCGLQGHIEILYKETIEQDYLEPSLHVLLMSEPAEVERLLIGFLFAIRWKRLDNVIKIGHGE